MNMFWIENRTVRFIELKCQKTDALCPVSVIRDAQLPQSDYLASQSPNQWANDPSLGQVVIGRLRNQTILPLIDRRSHLAL